MLLGVVAGVHLVAELEVAQVGFGLAGEDPQQAGLAGTVEPEHEQPLAAPEVEVDVLEDRRPAVRLAQALTPRSRSRRSAAGRGTARSSVLRCTAAPSTRSASRRAIRFSTLWAIAALVALAPKRSTTVCSRSISLACCRPPSWRGRRSSSARARGTGCTCRGTRRSRRPSSSVARSRWSTRVIDSSSSSRSWLMTSSAPLYSRRKPRSHVLASMSRWLVGSSRHSTSEPANRMRASSTRRRSPPDSVPIGMVEPVVAGSRDRRPSLAPRSRPRTRRSIPNALLGAGVARDVAFVGVSSIAMRSFSMRTISLVDTTPRQHVRDTGCWRRAPGRAWGPAAGSRTPPLRTTVPRRRLGGAAEHLEQDWSCRHRCGRRSRPCPVARR